MSLVSLPRGPRGLTLRAPGLLGPELALAAFADWLFWNRGVGVSLPIFCAAVAIVALRLRRGRSVGPRRGAVALLLLAAAMPATYRVTALSVAFALAGTLAALRLDADPGALGGFRRLAAAARLIVCGPGRVVLDLARRRRLLARRGGPRAGLLWWVAWIAPMLLLALFTALLGAANPVIAGWLADVPVPSVDDVLAFLPRALFWAAVLCGLWPLIRRRRRRPVPQRPEPLRIGAGEVDRLASLLLSPAAVLRTLLLLDLLLALQLGLDGAYLWGGAALPGGMTYAVYAHRGAYPLVATALIAGALALAIRRPGAPPPSRPVAALLLLFLGENVLVVVSAMGRLALYVEAYALTEWRVAAFAWMGLVAFGLGSIAVQGALGHGPRGLLRANALAALALLYGWCFLDVPRLVADYDVAHCAETRGEGPSLDLRMLEDLGPDALPALDRYALGVRPWAVRAEIRQARASLENEVRGGMSDWRSWSLAGWRLSRYLDTVEAAAAVDSLRESDDP